MSKLTVIVGCTMWIRADWFSLFLNVLHKSIVFLVNLPSMYLFTQNRLRFCPAHQTNVVLYLGHKESSQKWYSRFRIADNDVFVDVNDLHTRVVN